MKTMISKFALAAALSVVVMSCTEKEEAVMAPSMNEMKPIPSVLATFDAPAADAQISDALSTKAGKAVTFKTLIAGLKATGLFNTAVQENLTLFAPSDEAFASLGLNHKNIGTVPGLKNILLYHAVAGKVYSNMLSDKFVPTLNGAAVEIKLGSGVMVNDATVIRADLPALNGVIHIIDKVMFPPAKNLVDLAVGFATDPVNPEFTVLVAAVTKAGLVETLATGGPFTVFAPTDAAFTALLGELGFSSLDEIPVDVLTNVLLYHVVSGRVYSSDLTSGPVTTLNGTFNVNVSTLKITDANGRMAGLIPSLLNVQASNGVVHVIDRVILP